MKFRSDFVTNSSSSSFIVAFKNTAERDAAFKSIMQRYSAETANIIINDIMNNKIDRKSAELHMREALEAEANYYYKYRTTDYFRMSEEEFAAKYPNIEQVIADFVEKKLDEAMAKIPKRGYIAEVSYSDNNGRIECDLEHNIMPYLPFTVMTMDHH